MQKLSSAAKIVIAAAIVIVLVVVAYSFGRGQNAATENSDNSGNTSATLTATSPTQTTTTTAGANVTGNSKSTGVAVAPKTPPAPKPPVISFITPVANDLWKIGAQDLISWSKASNITGSISLINATTKQSVGVILPEVGPNQTSYTWNTRDLLLDRTNAEKKDVVPGTYMITIAFDGNNLQPITSPTFTITD